jgi:hypothetical protein
LATVRVLYKKRKLKRLLLFSLETHTHLKKEKEKKKKKRYEPRNLFSKQNETYQPSPALQTCFRAKLKRITVYRVLLSS